MKTLYLVRHAKSDKGNPLLKDSDRPLNERGYDDAYFMSALMQKENHVPEMLLSSPAVRAYSTALIFLKTFGFRTGRLKLNDLLFEEDAEIYIEEIISLPNKYNSIMIVAHNPAISEVANILSDKSGIDFPTCGIVCIDFEITNWEGIGGKKGRLRFFEFPEKNL